MSIGNALFTKFATQGFSKAQSEISDLQGLISSGKNDPRASADQMRAAQLSAFTEQRSAVDHFTNAADQAASRISLTDQAIGDASAILLRFQELATQAGNDTLPAEGLRGIKAEALELRKALIEVANRGDALGQPLFSGYSAAPAFVEEGGAVKYLGDDGRPSQRLSETLTLAIGVNGKELFGAVDTPAGRTDTFELVDRLISSFDVEMYKAKSTMEADGRAQLRLYSDRADKTVSFTLVGPEGTAEISANMVSGLQQPLIDAINAKSVETGVMASLSPSGDAIVIESEGRVALRDFGRSDDPSGQIGTFQQLEFRGQAGSDEVALRTTAMNQSSMLGRMQDVTGHFAEKRAQVGGMGATVDAQKEALDLRRLNIDEAIAGLEDLDIAAAVTRLQNLLLTRDASQQTFVKITRTSLFDYLR